jgi:hypothetical protein
MGDAARKTGRTTPSGNEIRNAIRRPCGYDPGGVIIGGWHNPMNRVRKFIRPDVVFSVIGHLAILLVGLLVFGAGSVRPPPPEPMAVELVPPEEAPPPPIQEAQNETKQDETQHVDGTAEESTTNGSEAYSTSEKGSAQTDSNRPKFQLPAPQDKPSDGKPQQTASLAAPQPQVKTPEEPQPDTQKADEPILPPDAQKDEQQPQPEQARTQPNPGDVFALPLTLPGGGLGGGLDALSPTPAMAPHDDSAAFRAHVSSCSHLPPEIGPGDSIKVVMRVYFKPDGTLAQAPEMLDATFSPKSSALMKIAVKALEDCQPFTELPKDKYKMWRIMDLTVTPRAMGR